MDGIKALNNKCAKEVTNNLVIFYKLGSKEFDNKLLFNTLNNIRKPRKPQSQGSVEMQIIVSRIFLQV